MSETKYMSLFPAGCDRTGKSALDPGNLYILESARLRERSIRDVRWDGEADGGATGSRGVCLVSCVCVIVIVYYLECFL